MSETAAVETRRKPFRGSHSAYLRRIAVWGAFMPLALAAIFELNRGSSGRPEEPGPRAYGAAVCVAAVLFGTHGVRCGDRRRRGRAVLALGAACAPCALFAALAPLVLLADFHLGARRGRGGPETASLRARQ